MKAHESYHLHCRLKEHMTRLGLTVDQLHRIARVSRETISQLRSNSFKGVSKRAISRICGALGLSIGELFEVLLEDIWLPIRLAGEVTIHFGSRNLLEPQPARGDGADVLISRDFVGSWDLRAFQRASAYLQSLRPGIQVRFEEHTTGAGRGNDPAVRASAKRLFEGGNHIVIGSPIANQFTEEVVCHAYGVSPYNPETRDAFPYGFVWDSWRHVRSSLGVQGQRKPFGIAALPSNRIVAPHVVVPQGEGKDGALILVHRIFRAPSRRESGDEVESVIICLLGISGPGTEAAARLATNPEFAAGLYPPARNVPRMRAIRCKTFRHASATPDDNREVTDVEPIPEHKHSRAPVESDARRSRGRGGR